MSTYSFIPIYHLPLCSNFSAVNYFSWGWYWFEVAHPTATKWRRGERSKASVSQRTKRSKTYWGKRYLTKNVFSNDCGIQIYQSLRLHPSFRMPLGSCIHTASVTDSIKHQCENKNITPAPPILPIWTHGSYSKWTASSKNCWLLLLKKSHSSLSAEHNCYSFHSQ